MYCINDKQIDFILNDIRRNGIELEDLQLNLLDHICCIIEQEFEANGDFEQFYFSIRKRFYKNNLSEIQQETNSLLTFKHYYVMKKAMMISGVFSAIVLTLGILFKFLHLAGASIGIVLGISVFSLFFLPLMVTLKIREKQNMRDKLLTLLGSLAAICISLAILFKVQYWPGANMLGLISIGILVLVFVPVYFITGIRQPDAKVNTVVSTVLMIIGCGLFLSLARTPQASYNMKRIQTAHYLRNEQLLQNERTAIKVLSPDAEAINSLCQQLKFAIIESETGEKQPDWNVAVLSEDRAWVVKENPEVKQLVNELKVQVDAYNKQHGASATLPSEIPVIEANDARALPALNDLVQLQLFLVQHEKPH